MAASGGRRLGSNPAGKQSGRSKINIHRKNTLGGIMSPLNLREVLRMVTCKTLVGSYDARFMIKARTYAYDGRGIYPVMSASDIGDALEALKGRSWYAEKWANFMELAVMVVKTENTPSEGGKGRIAYSAVETIHEDSVCKLVYAPPRNDSQDIQQRAQQLARKAVGNLWGKGVFGVELSLMGDGQLTVNKSHPDLTARGDITQSRLAPHSHNTSPSSSPSSVPCQHFQNSTITGMSAIAVMLNILGGASKGSHNGLMN
ncbi:uncharacterized protein BP5553_10586 [Venustampulla echinocandica]|uniref:ATP-grasp domain-containing protein n=1 Tax=Venustampulla echinocandica TaxID=2656787 RepID=A0A370T8Z8_9HELO|nr:uncharacterized protein BP5553_10586 [Venustampulla echinocandica]RDL29959.1 hypothetical protein BP5553_10586 [Venustampulla echinocandica]